jgi:hypothetical protein
MMPDVLLGKKSFNRLLFALLLDAKARVPGN